MSVKRLLAADTNILVYAEIEKDDPRCGTAIALLDQISGERRLVLPVQVIGELIRVLSIKFKQPWPDVAKRASLWRANALLYPSDPAVLDGALTLVADHRFAIWDAMILSAAAEAKCALLLTEDMHDGFVWRGCTVANPFAAVRHPLLVSLLG